MLIKPAGNTSVRAAFPNRPLRRSKKCLSRAQCANGRNASDVSSRAINAKSYYGGAATSPSGQIRRSDASARDPLHLSLPTCSVLCESGPDSVGELRNDASVISGLRRNSPPSRPIDSGKFWRMSRHAAGDRSWPISAPRFTLATTVRVRCFSPWSAARTMERLGQSWVLHG